MPFRHPFLKAAAEEKPYPPPKPLFPLSLSFPLPNLVDEGCPRPCSTSRKATIKLCDSGLLRHIFIGFISTYFKAHILSWCVRWPQTNDVLNKLRSYVTRFLPRKWRRGKGLWENLPLDLCGEVGKRMVGRLDVLRFRSVCKQWRLSLPSPTLFPLRVPPPPCLELRNVAYFITECNIYYTRCGIVHMGVEELGQGSRFRRPIPICPSTAKFDWPRVSFMGDRKHPLSQFSFVGKFYCVREGLPCSNTLERPLQCTLSVRKVVIISSNSNAEGVVSSTTEGVNPGYVRVSHLSAVAILSKEAGAMWGRLALLRLGGRGENGNWNWETDFCSQAFEDIASYKGKLCAVDSTARVFLMDYHSLQMTQIAGAAKIAPGKRSKRLLEYGENLYSADFSRTVGRFVVLYKLNLERRVWERSRINIQTPDNFALVGRVAYGFIRRA